MFIYADVFLALVRQFRVLTIEGRYGGGKTLLAVAIAKHLLESGFVDNCFTNFPCKLANNPDLLFNTVIILDEAWMTLFPEVSGKTLREYIAFLRKLNNVLLLPSVLPLRRELRIFSVTRYLDLSIFGLPVWIYRWSLQKTREKGYFALFAPSRYFHLYEHSYAPCSDGGLKECLAKTIMLYQQQQTARQEQQQTF